MKERVYLTNLNQETFGHSVRVSMMTRDLCRRMGLSESDVFNITTAALYHDVGKKMIPKEILEKPGKYTPEEYDVMKNHTKYSAQILKDMSSTIKTMVLYHHESEDGNGYLGKTSYYIPLGAKIIHIVDVFDAMLSKRCYKDEMSVDKVFESMEKDSSFNQEILKIFKEGVYAGLLR